MIQFSIKKILAPLLLLVFLIPLVTVAQEGNAAVANPVPVEAPVKKPLSFVGSDTTELPDTVNCFDYYTFGSVQVDIEPSVEGTVSGVPLTFFGTIVNSNPYPIVHGQLLVKIYKTAESVGDDTHQNGYPVVDQFFALEDVTVAANSKTPITFEWEVPTYLLSGDYELNTFFMTGKRFNLLGLPFTDDVTGNKVNFSVLGQATQGVAFNKNSVTLNQGVYSFAGFPPTFSATETVTISTLLVNETMEAKTIPVTWTLYNWAGERVENKLDTKTENVTLAPNEEKIVSYTTATSTGAVSFVQAIANYKDTKSILNIRFNRENKSEMRLNYPSILSYPLVAGREMTVFSCLHSTSQPSIAGGKLVLTLTDNIGAVIHTYTYTGSVTGAMMGVKDSFVPERNITDFTLTASLYKDNKKVEEVNIDYNCRDIDKTLCVETEEIATTTITQTQTDDTTYLKQLTAGVLALITFGLVLLFSRWKNSKLVAEEWSKSSTDSLTMVLAWCCLIPLSAVLFLTPQTVAAKSVTYTNPSASGVLYHKYNSSAFDNDFGDSAGNDWHSGLNPTFLSVTYKAALIDAVTGTEFTSGTPLPIGAKFRVAQTNRNVDTDISWAGTGYGFDSPYGRWEIDANPPSPMDCWGGSRGNALGAYIGSVSAGNWAGSNKAEVFGYLSVHPPIPMVILPSDNITCVGNVCTVNDIGPVTVGLQFPSTSGKFYFRYRTYYEKGFATDLPLGVCIGSDYPMREYGQNNDFVLTVPEQTISFNLRATKPSSNPPTKPVITPRGTNNNYTEFAQFFAVESSDADGDQLHYVIDWDPIGKSDQLAPGTGYIDGDAPINISRAWANAGTYTFRVLAEDEFGSKSPWATYMVTITKVPMGISSVSLSVTGCPILLGESQCAGQARWNFINAEAPYRVINETTNTVLGTTDTGLASVVFEEGINTITAAAAGEILGTKIVTVRCDAGATWYGGVCIDDHTPVLNLEINPPVVHQNGTTTVTWTIFDMTMNTCSLQGIGGLNEPITTTVGSLVVGPLASAGTIQLLCTSPLHVDTSTSTTVEILPTVFEI